MQLQFKGVSDHTIIQFLCRQTKKKKILFCCLGLDKRLITFQSTESHIQCFHTACVTILTIT